MGALIGLFMAGLGILVLVIFAYALLCGLWEIITGKIVSRPIKSTRKTTVSKAEYPRATPEDVKAQEKSRKELEAMLQQGRDFLYGGGISHDEFRTLHPWDDDGC